MLNTAIQLIGTLKMQSTPLLQDVSATFRSVAASYTRVSIVVDALDGCFEEERTMSILPKLGLQAAIRLWR